MAMVDKFASLKKPPSSIATVDYASRRWS
jgi:hypothetical protein